MSLVREAKLPFTVDITDGRKRSLKQNDLQFRWINEVAQYQGDDPETVRASAKLMFGIPILRRDSEKFRKVYDRLIKRHSFEEKVCIIRDMDFGVTRLMTVTQKREYLDSFERYYRGAGVQLTITEVS